MVGQRGGALREECRFYLLLGLFLVWLAFRPFVLRSNLYTGGIP